MAQSYKVRLGDGTVVTVDPDGLRAWLEDDGATVQVPGTQEWRPLREVVAEVVEACERLAFSGSRATLNLRVAVGEALSNAILYGNREDPQKLVRVSAALHPGSAEVTISDEGPGFDPGAIADPTRPENRGRSHGRGLFLLRSLADEVRFNDRGNSVTLTLKD